MRSQRGIRDGLLVPRYFDFEVTIVLARRVWRRFLLRKGATFYELHRAIQDSFGWLDYHLFEFRHPNDSRRPIAGIPDPDQLMEDRPTPDAKRVYLKDYFWASRGMMGPQWYEYEYDFGDGWIHEVKLRGEVSVPETFKRRLIGGERAAPPEDCGGEYGYERMIAVVETGIDPEGEDPREILQWLGGWHPDAFDIEQAALSFSPHLAARPARQSPNTRH